MLPCSATPPPAVTDSGKPWLPDEPRMVYVANLPWSTKWQDLKDHMKQAGEVEFARILTMDGSDWGRSRGIAYVRYSTEEQARAAVAMLDRSTLGGRTITVDVWTGNKPRSGPVPGKGGKGFGSKGYGGWCWPGGKGFRGKSDEVHGDVAQLVYVGNLPFKIEWQEIKDHMKQAGAVEFVKILTEDGSEYGRSKGSACVRFSSVAEANGATQMLGGTLIGGRAIVVDKWRRGGGKGAGATSSAPPGAPISFAPVPAVPSQPITTRLADQPGLPA